MKRLKWISLALIICIIFSFGVTINTDLSSIRAGNILKSTKDAYAECVTTVLFPENTSRTQTKIVNIPNLGSVSSVTVNNGNVTYSKSGDNITIVVSNGLAVRTQYDSKTVNTSNYTGTTYPPSTTQYSDAEGYSGTLSRTSIIDNGDNQTQTQYFSSSWTNNVTDTYNCSGTLLSETQTSPAPSSVLINQNGYYGYIPRTGTSGPVNLSTTYCTVSTHNPKHVISKTNQWTALYSGNLTKTVHVPSYTGYYSGTVSGTVSFYSYTVSINYLINYGNFSYWNYNDNITGFYTPTTIKVFSTTQAGFEMPLSNYTSRVANAVNVWAPCTGKSMSAGSSSDYNWKTVGITRNDALNLGINYTADASTFCWESYSLYGHGSYNGTTKSVNGIYKVTTYFIWDKNNTKSNYFYDDIDPCKWDAIFAHEFGHALGYFDHDRIATSTNKSLMAPLVETYYDEWKVTGPQNRDIQQMNQVY